MTRKKILNLMFTMLIVLLMIQLKLDSNQNESERVYPPIIQIIDPNKPMVAITYDDGPHQSVTPQLLDIFETYNSKATFFILGSRVTNHYLIIQRMVDSGHELGNHTYGHIDFNKLSVEGMMQQLNASNDTLSLLVDSHHLPVLVRTPFGNINESQKKAIPYPIIGWSIDTKDWLKISESRIVDEVLSQVKDGDIILMHDMYQDTVDATEIIVKTLINDGYQLVTVSEMFKAKGITLTNGEVYKNAW